MATFYYQGRNADGSKASGLVEAATEELAAEMLLNKGIVPTSIAQGAAEKSAFDFNWKALLTPSVPLEVLVIFCRQMFSLTKAGVPLLRSMRGLAQNCHNKQLKAALDSVCNELTNGRNLSASMQLHPAIFSPLFVSMIQHRAIRSGFVAIGWLLRTRSGNAQKNQNGDALPDLRDYVCVVGDVYFERQSDPTIYQHV